MKLHLWSRMTRAVFHYIWHSVVKSHQFLTQMQPAPKSRPKGRWRGSSADLGNIAALFPAWVNNSVMSVGTVVTCTYLPHIAATYPITAVQGLIEHLPTSHCTHNLPILDLKACSHNQNPNMAEADATPPPLRDVPTAKQKKYDRQLRLWGASGQQALEDAHILLINSGSGVTGVETLKNLVLPGIGNYTILDSALVSEADLGVNFFLDESAIGGFRAEHTCRLLQELNPDVNGHFITEVRDIYFKSHSSLS